MANMVVVSLLSLRRELRTATQPYWATRAIWIYTAAALGEQHDTASGEPATGCPACLHEPAPVAWRYAASSLRRADAGAALL